MGAKLVAVNTDAGDIGDLRTDRVGIEGADRDAVVVVKHRVVVQRQAVPLVPGVIVKLAAGEATADRQLKQHFSHPLRVVPDVAGHGVHGRVRSVRTEPPDGDVRIR